MAEDCFGSGKGKGGVEGMKDEIRFLNLFSWTIIEIRAEYWLQEFSRNWALKRLVSFGVN